MISLCEMHLCLIYMRFILLNQNFFIAAIIQHCHMPPSELHSNCTLLSEEPPIHSSCLYTQLCTISLKGTTSILSSSLLNPVVLHESLHWRQEMK